MEQVFVCIILCMFVSLFLSMSTEVKSIDSFRNQRKRRNKSSQNKKENDDSPSLASLESAVLNLKKANAEESKEKDLLYKQLLEKYDTLVSSLNKVSDSASQEDNANRSLLGAFSMGT